MIAALQQHGILGAKGADVEAALDAQEAIDGHGDPPVGQRQSAQHDVEALEGAQALVVDDAVLVGVQFAGRVGAHVAAPHLVHLAPHKGGQHEGQGQWHGADEQVQDEARRELAQVGQRHEDSGDGDGQHKGDPADHLLHDPHAVDLLAAVLGRRARQVAGVAAGIIDQVAGGAADVGLGQGRAARGHVPARVVDAVLPQAIVAVAFAKAVLQQGSEVGTVGGKGWQAGAAKAVAHVEAGGHGHRPGSQGAVGAGGAAA